MKSRHIMPGIILFITFSLMFFLTSCVNRLQDYEPYSTFDERMEAYEQGEPIPTDEMPIGPYDQYTSYSGDGAMWGDQPQSNYQPRIAHRRPSSGSSSGGDEVPFDNSRGPKHAANIGAL